MFAAFTNTLKIPELRKRILFTMGILALVRVAGLIPCPGVDMKVLDQLFNSRGGGGGVMDMLNLFSGGAMQRFAIAALGIMPYISASIIMQLMTPVLPSLEKLSREGDSGRQQLHQYTRYLTVFICIIQGAMYARGMINPRLLGAGSQSPVIDPSGWFVIQTVIIITAGTMLLMWLGEQITERGIGSGASLIISVNIIARLPAAIFSLVKMTISGAHGGTSFGLIHAMILLALFFAVCAGTVALTQAVRKIPIRHASRSFGRGRQSSQTSYLPLRVNFAGVMPIIFANAILAFPAMLFNWIPYTRDHAWSRFVAWGSGWYMFFFMLAVVLFAFFWVAQQFNPMRIADNLQQSGGYVPGIRPGLPTAEFLDHTMTRITVAGAAFLVGVALFPMVLTQNFDLPPIVAGFFGGTSLLIITGVMLDTMRQIESHLLSNRYDGFLSKGHLRSRR